MAATTTGGTGGVTAGSAGPAAAATTSEGTGGVTAGSAGTATAATTSGGRSGAASTAVPPADSAVTSAEGSPPRSPAVIFEAFLRVVRVGSADGRRVRIDDCVPIPLDPATSGRRPALPICIRSRERRRYVTRSVEGLRGVPFNKTLSFAHLLPPGLAPGSPDAPGSPGFAAGCRRWGHPALLRACGRLPHPRVPRTPAPPLPRRSAGLDPDTPA